MFKDAARKHAHFNLLDRAPSGTTWASPAGKRWKSLGRDGSAVGAALKQSLLICVFDEQLRKLLLEG